MVNPTTTGDSDKAEVSSAVAANSDCITATFCEAELSVLALAHSLPAGPDETAGVGVWSLPRSGGRGGGRTRYQQ